MYCLFQSPLCNQTIVDEPMKTCFCFVYFYGYSVIWERLDAVCGFCQTTTKMWKRKHTFKIVILYHYEIKRRDTIDVHDNSYIKRD